MKFTPIDPPRFFAVGPKGEIQLKDCARIELAPDEQVTFVTDSGAEYDVVKKSWGFYATPSLNKRLVRFGLRAALIKSPDGRFYVFLIEQDKFAEFQRYRNQEDLTAVGWLDSDQGLRELERTLDRQQTEGTALSQCYLCGGTRFIRIFSYDAPPEGETQFQFSAPGAYRREVFRCNGCGHFVSVHDMDLSGLYKGDYVNSTYGGDGLRRAFERITALDPEQSDNAGRVKRILEFSGSHFSSLAVGNGFPTVLDVGSGLCVFLHRMKAAGWNCTALDPDLRAVKHAQEAVGVTAVCGDLMTAQDLGRFDAVTFNKVLEHVKDPVALLAKALEHVRPGGFVYVEVPDGEAAVVGGPGREEFFIEHWHIFSAMSLTLLAARAGFSMRTLERLREPSGKYTLRAFLAPGPSLVSREGQEGECSEPQSS